MPKYIIKILQIKVFMTIFGICDTITRNEKEVFVLSYKTKNIIVYIAVVIFSILFCYFGNKYTMANYKLLNNQGVDATHPGVITEITNEQDYTYQNGLGGSKISFKCTLKDTGEEIEGTQVVDDYDPVPYRKVTKGDKILLDYDDTNGWQFTEYIRTDALLVLGAIFLIALLFFGRTKGLNTIISLGFTCIAIFAVFIPAVISGQNIYLWSVGICAYTIIMTLLIVNGPNTKTLTSCIGCFGGVVLAGILTFFMTKILALTGVVDESSYSLTTVNPDHPIVIGAMGAVMDVAMSLSSSLHELKLKVMSISPKELFKSGMVIGRDMMGTMANTLVLAYIGSSLTVTVLIVIYNSSMTELLNKERIVVEILQALVGSIGILFTIPFTCFVCAMLYRNLKPYDNNVEFDEYAYCEQLAEEKEAREARALAKKQAKEEEARAIKEGKEEANKF